MEELLEEWGRGKPLQVPASSSVAAEGWLLTELRQLLRNFFQRDSDKLQNNQIFTSRQDLMLQASIILKQA